ncbi:hypothetical protein SLS64_010343 [Diaporthe eres]|uniref:CorA-like transporter domain-containing protein n=1 Tax=Diaporthe eres TaxID=83184 RepID=A0ABR1NQ46_DIAER
MPSFLDFLFAYGSMNTKREARSSGFRVESNLAGANGISVIDQFGRSDRRYQISYNIKSLSRYAVSNNWDDIVRQVAVHHQFDATTGKQLWIFGDPHADLKKAIGTRFREQHQHAVFDGMFQDISKPNMDMVQNVQWRILGLDEAIVVLESNEAIMTSLGKFYSDASQELQDGLLPGVEDSRVKEALKSFTYDLNNHIREAQLQRQHLMVLQKILTERKSMVRSIILFRF